MDRASLYRAVVWSTITGLVISLGCANLDGRPNSYRDSAYGHFEHGWPTVFMLRPLMYPGDTVEGRSLLHRSSEWAWEAAPAEHFDWLRLCCNVAVCAAMICLAVVALERTPANPKLGHSLQQIAVVAFLGGAIAWGWSNDVHTLGVGNLSTYVLVLVLMGLIVSRTVLTFLHGQSLPQETASQLEASRS